MFLAKYKPPEARHINNLEWSTWKYLMDWGEQISVASHSHLPFCEQSVFPCSRQWNLGTTNGVSVSLHALFVREPGSEPSRALTIRRCKCNISIARASLSSERLCGEHTSHPGPHGLYCSHGDTSVDCMEKQLVLQGLHIFSQLSTGMVPA